MAFLEIRNFVLKDSIQETISNLDSMDEKTREKMFFIFVSDHYKIRVFDCILRKDSQHLDGLIDSMVCPNTDNLYDESYLKTIIRDSIKFNSLNKISKIYMMEIFSNKGFDELFLDISKIYYFDQQNYKFSYDINSFKEYYIETRENKTILSKEDVSKFISEKLLELEKSDYEKYKKIILEIIIGYYKWNFFAANNIENKPIYTEDYMYLSLISSNSFENILKYLKSNVTSLITIIDEYLFYSTQDNKISYEIINKFYHDNPNLDIEKKLR